MKNVYLFILAVLMFAPSILFAADANFSWLPNIEPALVGYKIHYGHESRNYTKSVDITNITPTEGRVRGAVTGLDNGRKYYFAVTAYSVDDESDFSNEISHTFRMNAPMEFEIAGAKITITAVPVH